MGADESGLTFQLVIGGWGGVHAGLLEHSFHVTIGWLSFQIWFLDMHKYTDRLQRITENYKYKIEHGFLLVNDPNKDCGRKRERR